MMVHSVTPLFGLTQAQQANICKTYVKYKRLKGAVTDILACGNSKTKDRAIHINCPTYSKMHLFHSVGHQRL